MNYLLEKIATWPTKLAQLFPGNSYQTNLDAYLSTKGITDAAQLENYIREFHNSHRELYL